jgi:hypothetical protein
MVVRAPDPPRPPTTHPPTRAECARPNAASPPHPLPGRSRTTLMTIKAAVETVAVATTSTATSMIVVAGDGRRRRKPLRVRPS